MKNLFKVFGIIAFVAVIGFSMAACSDDGGDGGGDDDGIAEAPASDFTFFPIHNSNGMEITDYKGPGGVVKIPSKYNGKPVTTIGA